jgi:16S rRNA (guanine966-N2)-methyltransferase
MRVIAGRYKSRPLRSVPGPKTRPTSDKLRETLFNVLTAGDPAALEGSVWLDVFAGTGAVGIEALSRGASQVTFIDSAKPTARIIRENLKSLAIGEGFEILEEDATKALRKLEMQGFMASYVFVDPPYADHEAYAEVLELLSKGKIVGLESTVMVEHDKRFDPGTSVGDLQRYRTLLQGDSGLSFYRKG